LISNRERAARNKVEGKNLGKGHGENRVSRWRGEGRTDSKKLKITASKASYLRAKEKGRF